MSKAHDRSSIAYIIKQHDSNNRYGDIITAIKGSDEQPGNIASKTVG